MHLLWKDCWALHHKESPLKQWRGLLLQPQATDYAWFSVIFRFWHYDEGGLCYMFSRPRLPSFLPYEWSCMCFTPLKQPGELHSPARDSIHIWLGVHPPTTHIGMCLATMVMCPAAGAGVKELITGELCALRQHVTMRAFKVYSRHSKSPKVIKSDVSILAAVQSR